MGYQPMRALADPLHFSALRCMSKSPAHYRAAVLSPREPTYAMRLGTAIHAVVLEQPYVVHDGTRRGKQWEAAQASAADSDALIITAA
ncbi:MAG TPA: hypothetical protein VMI75_17190, partial [Polyangiaceae bacterium]|nr:hypothetical protein [Polyangiaceae bacterium]